MIKKYTIITVLLLLLVIPGCGNEKVNENNQEVAIAEETNVVEEPTVSEEVVEGAEEKTIDEETESEDFSLDASTDNKAIDLEDGVYLAEFHTDSNMFHVNEAKDGKGVMTVTNGEAVIHVLMPSKSIQILYPGKIDKAADDVENQIPATEDEVTYEDGMTETVNAFDVKVPYLDEEFDLALIGKKGTWYDHRVYVSNPVPYTEEAEEDTEEQITGSDEEIKVSVTLEGGTGKAKLDSPTTVKTDENGQLMAVLRWSSPNYDYMIVSEEKYLPVNTEGNSVFEIPIESLNTTMDVIADTTAMSTPHEIEYKITLEEVK